MAANFSQEAFDEVLDSAARLQELVPDAVLVGGSAAAFYARHRYSRDADHVLADLKSRFEVVLDALEREGDWVTNRVTPGKIILGEIGGIEAGVRQLIRTTPLEIQTVTVGSGRALRVPTAAETLRIKAFLIVKRNQVRDYLDVVALADFHGVEPAARVLSRIDDYYADRQPEDSTVATQLLRQLANPRPKDQQVTEELAAYKGIRPRWQNWETVVAESRDLAASMSAVLGGAS